MAKIDATVQARMKELEDLISNSQYNKKTQKAIGIYKARLAALKEGQVAKSRKGPATDGYSVKKSGDATVVLVGFPSVGKSTLLNKITNAESEVGAYEFTTLSVVPGLMRYKDAKIQVLDVPGIVHGAAAGTGRGREVLSVMRTADLAVIIVDVTRPQHYKPLIKEIRDSGLRINERKPDVKIKKTGKGGIDVGSTIRLTKLNRETIVAILQEFRTRNAHVLIRDNISVDQFIDVIEANKVYIPGIVLLNKVDLVSKERLAEIQKDLRADLCISADNDESFINLKDAIFNGLDFIRIYTKEQSKPADMTEPIITRRGTTIAGVCRHLHRDFVTNFKYSKIWGPSAKFPGQRKGLTHKVKDGDIVEIHVR